MSLSTKQFDLLHEIGVDGGGSAVCHMPLSDDILELIIRELVVAFADEELAGLAITEAGWRQLAS